MVDIKKYGITAFGAVPNERQLEHLKIGKKAFFHFGVNTFSNREWGDGTELEKLFDPSELDTDQWIRVIKDAGFKLAIITAKHHDGFCLWPSKYTEHSVKNSPYKNGKGDVIKEFTDSCRKYGIKAGVYISPWDRHSPLWGKDEYSDFYAKQLTELVTEYGELHEIWWDGAGSSETRYDWDTWESIIRKHQPNAAIFGSLGAAEFVDMRWVGNELGSAGETHYASIDPEILLKETVEILNVGQIGARKYIPSETDVSIRPGWFYHTDQDDLVKSASEINRIWFESIGRNSMMLLNFPPDRRGLICDRDAENAISSHKNISKMLSKNYVNGALITPIDPTVEPLTVTDSADGASFRIFPCQTVEIELKKAETLNTFAVSELVEAGERVTEFTLESLDESGRSELLYEGTSIGFYKIARFKEGEYRRFRFSVKSALAQPLLKGFGLHRFEDIAEEASSDSTAEHNLVKLVESYNDGKIAVAAFDGIFPFNRIGFKTSKGSHYKVFSFDGASFYEIANGVTQDEIVRIELPITVGSYQIKIESESSVSDISVINA